MKFEVQAVKQPASIIKNEFKARGIMKPVHDGTNQPLTTASPAQAIPDADKAARIHR